MTKNTEKSEENTTESAKNYRETIKINQKKPKVRSLTSVVVYYDYILQRWVII